MLLCHKKKKQRKRKTPRTSILPPATVKTKKEATVSIYTEEIKTLLEKTRYNEGFKFEPSTPQEYFNLLLSFIQDKPRQCIEEKKPMEILILPPFLYKHYVKKFSEFIKNLQETYKNLEVVVVTRHPEDIGNKG